MNTGIDYELVDLALFAAANLVNFLLGAMFLARARHRPAAARGLGTASMVAGLPILAVPILNALGGRELILILLPLPYAAHWILELILDYVLKRDFRSTWVLRPYLGVFYLAQIGLIGYSFAMGREYGFSTLATYFFCLAATGFSYRRVGHGVPEQG
jgi:hypothetical protein